MLNDDDKSLGLTLTVKVFSIPNTIFLGKVINFIVGVEILDFETPSAMPSLLANSRPMKIKATANLYQITNCFWVLSFICKIIFCVSNEFLRKDKDGKVIIA
jgi:hypothetical protein